MARLIDADALREKYTMVIKRYERGIMECPAVLLEDIDEAPTIDAVSVVRGEWIDRSDGGRILHPWWESYECMNCGYSGSKAWNFCPNCGADMRGDGK